MSLQGLILCAANLKPRQFIVIFQVENESLLWYNSIVPNKNLRPLVKPDDQTKFKLAGMIFQLARTKHSKIQKTFYSKFITAILNLSNILERIFVNKINEWNLWKHTSKDLNDVYLKENLFHYDLLLQIVGCPSGRLNPEFRLPES